MTEPASGYRQVDHTADLALEIWGPTEEAMLAAGARAVIDLVTQGAAIAPDAERTVHISGLDPEDRLVQWLNEVLVAAVVDGFLFADARIDLRGADLTAHVRGQAGAGALVVAEMKSATYHDLRLIRSPGGARAHVVIDV